MSGNRTLRLGGSGSGKYNNNSELLNKGFLVNDAVLSELQSMGFEYDLCVHSLMLNGNQLQPSIEWLLQNAGAGAGDSVAMDIDTVVSGQGQNQGQESRGSRIAGPLPLYQPDEEAKNKAREDEQRRFEARRRAQLAEEARIAREKRRKEEERIRELIRKEKEERKKKVGTRGTTTTTASTAVSHSSGAEKDKGAGKASILLRFPDGSRQQIEVMQTAILSVVFDEVLKSEYAKTSGIQDQSVQSVVLATVFPPRVKYEGKTSSNLNLVISDIGLVPNGVLAVSFVNVNVDSGVDMDEKDKGAQSEDGEGEGGERRDLVFGGSHILGGSGGGSQMHPHPHSGPGARSGPIIAGSYVLGGAPRVEPIKPVPQPEPIPSESGSEYEEDEDEEDEEMDYHYNHDYQFPGAGHKLVQEGVGGSGSGGKHMRHSESSSDSEDEDDEERVPPPFPFPEISGGEGEGGGGEGEDEDGEDYFSDDEPEPQPLPFTGAGHVLGAGIGHTRSLVDRYYDSITRNKGKGKSSEDVSVAKAKSFVPSLEKLCILTAARHLNSYTSIFLTEYLAQEVISASVTQGTLSKKTIKAFHPTQLETLSLSLNPEVTNSFLSTIVTHLPTIENLELTNCYGITYDGLHVLEKLQYLQYLNLSGCKIASQGLKTIGKLRSLICLDLSTSHITDNGIDALEQLGELEHLDLKHNPGVTSRSLKSISKLTNLVSLILSGTSTAQLYGLEKLTSLEVLSIASTAVADDCLSASVSVSDMTEGKTEGKTVFDHLTSLCELDCSNTLLSRKGLRKVINSISAASIGCMEKMEEEQSQVSFSRLHLPTQSMLRNSLLSTLSTLTTLIELDLSDASRLTKFAPLSKLVNLKCLTLRNTKFIDSDILHLTSLIHLEELNLSKTYITDAAIQNLVDISSGGGRKCKWYPGLQTLSISFNRLTIEAVKLIPRFSNLRSLDMRRIAASHEDISMLVTHLIRENEWPHRITSQQQLAF